MAPRSSAKSKSNKSGKGFGLLWLITGILIGLFVASLSFLKKHVTVVEQPSQNVPAKIQAANHTNATHAKNSVAASAATQKKTGTTDGERYDFYTMLPNMQVSQQNPNAPAATSEKPATKPTKPLALAEQNMLAPQATSANATTPQAPATATTGNVQTSAPNQAVTASTTTAAPVPKQEKPAAPTKYRINLGNFATYNQADAKKAELVMSGVDNAKIESYQSNGSTKYRLIIGPFSNQEEANKQFTHLQQNQVSAKLESN